MSNFHAHAQKTINPVHIQNTYIVGKYKIYLYEL
jgi:hypothetical protein